MFLRLTNIRQAEEALREIEKIVAAHAEWLYLCAGRAPTPLRQSELDFYLAHGRLVLYSFGTDGAQTWHVSAWEWTGRALRLEAQRRTGKVRATLELIPRLSARLAQEEIGAYRRARSAQLAHLSCESLRGATIERAGLSAGARANQPGSFARIILKHKGARICVTGIVTETGARNIDAFISSTLLWYTRLSERTRGPRVEQLWIAVERDSIETARATLALLRASLRHAIKLYEIDWTRNVLTYTPQSELEELLSVGAPPFRRPATHEMSETAARITALAPHAIDVLRTRHGETLRFHGLAFARVRRIMRKERVWFGVDSSRRVLLDEATLEEWEKLLRELTEHRSGEAVNHRHALYRLAPEAWLESILRRDITRLDPGLRLAPLHAQFRLEPAPSSAPRPVDLLALRHDGRLVVIELKVSEDREHVLQGADYWRRVEIYRRSGAIHRAHLFDDIEILDQPPLVYLVAPTLRFHRAFNTLAHSIRKEIEIYRFDINEDWRVGVRVVRRCDLT